MKRYWIISPHIDDAFLSLGGSILNWIDTGIQIRICNVFTISNWTNPQCNAKIANDTRRVTYLRKREEQSVAKLANSKYEFWDFFDFPLRKKFTASQTKEMKGKIKLRIQQYLNKKDAFFFPLGIGRHVDHLIINRIGMNLRKTGFKIFFYEDMPYASWTKLNYKKKHAQDVLIEKVNINKKLNILKNYRSQVPSEWLQNIRLYSYNPTDNQHYERYWSINLKL